MANNQPPAPPLTTHPPLIANADLGHPWNVSPEEALAIQERLRSRVITEDDLPPVRRVAGADLAFDEAETRAAVAILTFPELTPSDYAVCRMPTRFPYVPGLLSFREVPAILETLAKLPVSPDIVLCDGQGLAHPRRFGLACHLGVLTGLPTIGVAKTRLLGEHAPLADRRGAWQPVWDGGERIGAVLRTRTLVRPLYVSIGHRVSLETAIDIVLACAPRYRLPETTRWAHRLASQPTLRAEPR